jgi:uroporphyrin-III C-methyltransferase
MHSYESFLMGIVYLVGAGFGTPDYLTLRAVDLLKHADCVLYDALLHTDCLNFCAHSCEKIYVGKRKNNHHLDQKSLNALLLESAQKHNTVVRLKGGTPTVFGRGSEEMHYLRSHGIHTHIIPGVSTSTGVPESFGIPLVDRHHNDAFRIITGHTVSKLDSLLTPYHPRENLIILMGASHAHHIVHILLTDKGYPPKTPIAFLCRGGCHDSEKIIMNLQKAHNKEASFDDTLRHKTPVTIFIGHTTTVSCYPLS